MTTSVVKAASGWVLVWQEKAIAGYTDYFTPGTLDRTVGRLSHLVVGPRGGREMATCSVEARDRYTDLDYSEYERDNERAGMALGVMRVHFDTSRQIRRVEWKAPLGRMKPAKVLASVGLPPVPRPYRPSHGKLRKPAHVAVRGAQARFRISVRAAYGDRCAISRCDIGEALEAVHIDPYENASQHHVCNGLLLRKDLHALFDRSLIAVDPKTMLVHIAPALQRYDEYQRMHGRARLSEPVVGYEGYAPDKTALARRWQIWQHLAAV